MRRRELMALLAVAIAANPKLASTQPADAFKRVGMLFSGVATNPSEQANEKAFIAALEQQGWVTGRNLVIERRWTGGETARARQYAAELISLRPDVLLAVGIAATAALREQTGTIPIVFTRVSDPVGQGFLTNVSRPGGNITGFTNFEAETGGKWLQVLLEVAPNLTHIAVLGNPRTSALDAYYRAVAEAAQRLHVEAAAVPLFDESDIARALASLSERGNAGAIVLPDGFTVTHRQPILEHAAKHRVPAVYPFQFFAADGGLVAYGVDTDEQFRQAAAYVDRILRGASVGNLPVQAPTKFELIINLKAARALGIDIPPSLLARADEVIE